MNKATFKTIRLMMFSFLLSSTVALGADDLDIYQEDKQQQQQQQQQQQPNISGKMFNSLVNMSLSKSKGLNKISSSIQRGLKDIEFRNNKFNLLKIDLLDKYLVDNPLSIESSKAFLRWEEEQAKFKQEQNNERTF